MFHRTLARILERDWLLVGVGNDMRGDDAFGPLLARRLRGKGLPALDGGTAPENLTGPILRAAPEELILADAADFGARAGSFRFFRPGDLAAGGVSTHDPGFGALLAYLTAQKPLRAWLLALQPASLRLGEPPGPHVVEAVDRLVRTIASVPRSAPRASRPRRPFLLRSCWRAGRRPGPG